MKTTLRGVLLLSAAAALGCGGERAGESTAGELAGSISADGSSTVYPITEAMAEEFGTEHEGRVRVTVGLSGTGGGFKRFCAGETDVSNASRPIKDSEKQLCQQNGVTYVELPVAYDGSGVEDDMWVDKNYLRQLIAKAKRPATDCSYRIVLFTSPGAQRVAGFSDCSLLPTGSLVARSAGTVIATGHMTPGGTYRHHAVVSIKKRAENEGRNVILALLSLGIGLKQVIVVDEDIDPFDPMQVDWAMATRFQADKDAIIIPRIACSTLDPSCPEPRVTAGLGIDATAPMKDRWRFEKVEIPGVDKVKYL